MKYEIASIPTRYKNALFRSRLEARWAAFADLAGWKWRYEPIDLQGWIPDFWFGIPCGHSECCAIPTKRCPRCGSQNRVLFYVPVMKWQNGKRTTNPQLDACGKPVTDPRYRCLACHNEYCTWECDPNFMHELYAEVKPYYSLEEFEGHPVTLIDPWEEPSPARFGIDPTVTEWQMAHGSGGGIESATDWDEEWENHWNEAGNIVQYRPARFFNDAEKERNTPNEN